MLKLKRHPVNPILAKNPNNHWEAGSVFNPCVIRDGELFRMYYRATNDIKTGEKGGYISSIGYAESGDGVNWNRSSEPVLAPSEPYDADGCEDARVTKIGDTYYLHSKAATLFPEKTNGKYWWLYTWEADRPQSTIMSVAAENLEEVVKPSAGQVANTLADYDTWAVFPPPANPWPNTISVTRGAEVGAPPLKTKDGWLFIYCNADTSGRPEWTIKAALLELDDPRKVIAETAEPILAPETDDERGGVTNNVTFPEGAVVVGDELYVYYGSGDQGCCLATSKLNELLNELKAHVAS